MTVILKIVNDYELLLNILIFAIYALYTKPILQQRCMIRNYAAH